MYGLLIGFVYCSAICNKQKRDKQKRTTMADVEGKYLLNLVMKSAYWRKCGKFIENVRPGLS